MLYIMKELKLRQVSLFLIAFIPVTKIFLLPSVLSGTSNEDLWISALLVFILEGITLFCLLYVSFNAKTDFYTLLKTNFNNATAKVVYIIYAIYFIVKSILPISEQKGYIELTLYETTPTILTFLPFFIISFYICLNRIRVIGRIADVFFFITLLALFIVFLLAFKNADFTAILPVGANGFQNIIKGSYFGLGYFGDAVYFLFFMGEYQKEDKGYLKVMLSFLASALIIIFFLIVFYCTFTTTASRQLFALTEIAKYKNVINNTGRFDYIATFLLLSSSVFAITMPLYFATYCLIKAFNIKKVIIPAMVVNLVVLIFLVVFSKSYTTIENIIKNYFGFWFLIMGNIIPILTIFLRRKNEAL